ncbi:hypothetical protein NRF20_14360 [Streptomyces sp. R-74717]|uniref:hypothetical protein n=1 Tax=Streptomyces sp. R-74717 TaxID=2969820 RepID=UPI0039B5FFB9
MADEPAPRRRLRREGNDVIGEGHGFEPPSRVVAALTGVGPAGHVAASKGGALTRESRYRRVPSPRTDRRIP